MNWLILVISLPVDGNTTRMRAWRALKAAGAAALRDGVYLLPDLPGQDAVLRAIGDDVRQHGGDAWLFCSRVDDDAAGFSGRFDRQAVWEAMNRDIAALAQQLQVAAGQPAALADAARQSRRLHKHFQHVAGIDFFPGTAQQQVADALRELDLRLARAENPDEPTPAADGITPRRRADFARRTWATRARPRIDRLASAWLVRRFIDPEARFAWLQSPADCPDDAVGFDFDGATFSHAGKLVTFETLITAFALQTPALTRLANLVHFLDVGGIAPPEAAGVERVLRGLRESLADDDALLNAALPLFDGLHADFAATNPLPG